MGQAGKWLALLVACVVLPVAAMQRTQTVAAGSGPGMAYADPVTGKVFILNTGTRGGAVTVLEPSGRATSVALDATPSHLAASAALRKLVVTQAGGQVAIVDMDSLAATALPAAAHPQRVVIAEATATAYVLATGGDRAGGTITAIDLRTRATRTVEFAQFPPQLAALDPSGGRLYVAGGRAERSGEWLPGYVQALDAASLRPDGAAQRVGRLPRDIAVAPAGDRIVLLGHADQERNDADPQDASRHGIRPALFVLDPTLRVRLAVDLPDTRNLAASGPALVGELQLDAAARHAYVSDQRNARLFVVDLDSGALRTTELESAVHALGVNPTAGTVLATMPLAGTVAVMDMEGKRLDTVPMARAIPGALAASYAIAVDPRSGDAYATNGHDGTVTILPRDPEGPAVANLTDLWHDPAEPGWGLFIDQQGATAFGALFVYGPGGGASWLVMSNGTRQPDGGFSGLLYRTQGQAQRGQVNALPVGILRITPRVGGGATLMYVVDGLSTTRRVERFGFAKGARPCGWTLDAAKASVAQANFTGLWSNPVDPGWGLALLHRGTSAFAVVFAYDEQNRPAWMVMSNGRATASGTFSGDLYRASRGRIEAMGSLSLRFAAATEGTLAYRIDGTDFRSAVLRQEMGPLLSRCAG